MATTLNLRESFGSGAARARRTADPQAEIDRLVVLVRSFTR